MLTRLQVEITADWDKRGYTTDPPRYVPFDVWSLVIRLRCAAPIRVVTLFAEGEHLHWANERGSPGAADHALSARFAPKDWLHSDDVQLSFGAGRTWLTDGDLKLDPRPLVRLDRSEALTGRPVVVATAERFGIALGIIAFAEEDTERRRQGRWRVKPPLSAALPAGLQGLASGHQSGRTGGGQPLRTVAGDCAHPLP
jgi:hypothetical protein